MSNGGIARMKPVSTSGVGGKMHFSAMPEFMRRYYGLLDPASVEEPTNRQQRRAKAARKEP